MAAFPWVIVHFDGLSRHLEACRAGKRSPLYPLRQACTNAPCLTVSKLPLVVDFFHAAAAVVPLHIDHCLFLFIFGKSFLWQDQLHHLLIIFLSSFAAAIRLDLAEERGIWMMNDILIHFKTVDVGTVSECIYFQRDQHMGPMLTQNVSFYSSISNRDKDF
jgi:hypothetical protein